ncbi:Protein DENND6-like [Gracilariopsis chorda]|uniref:Protein DENND6-like n=1 Tax=Gracilariopsis chorda TaxID=448386 RepID=A0A2V3IR47_9FLOR|nr:Protein DENND6-like [Gracilariopsis chorda]|eukprot:PXF44592.1 Protein DENND6-like [Gracilariopsis chorda]
MPDSASAASGHEDALYSFRITSHNQNQPLLLAHTLFRQAPDPSNARGFFQKALVIVSSLCYVTLANVLLTSLASTAFTHGEQALQRAVRDVSSWPDPRLHPTPHTLELPFINHTITLSIPSSFSTSFASPDAILMASATMSSSDSLTSPTAVHHVSSTSSHPHAQHSHSRVAIDTPQLVRMWPLCVSSATASAQPFQEIHLASALQGVHDKLWAIWELVALGEPLLVLGATPSQCASAVMCIVGLIHPLPFVGDWRPYYCIQDTTYATLAAAKDGSILARGAVYGVTNSHLADSLPFEHIVVLPGAEAAGKTLRAGLRSTHKSSLHKARQVSSALQSALSSYLKGTINADQLAQQARDTICDRITKPFLLPFTRYLVPTWSDGSALRDEPNVSDPFGKRLTLIDFDASTFPTSDDLALVSGGNFGKGAAYLKRVRALYERFLRGAVFDEWWSEARKVAEKQCAILHRGLMIEACARGSLLRKMRFEGRPLLTELIDRVDKELEIGDGNDDVLYGNLVALTDALKLCLTQSVGDSVDSELDDESTLLLA